MDVLQGDTDWERFSDSSSCEDMEELDLAYNVHASDILSSMEESIGKIDDVLLYERGFDRGDIVRSVTDPSDQMGRVINVTMSVDLENFNGEVKRNVDSKNLSKLRSISVGDYVIYGPWVGRVDKVFDRITVLFDDGTKCEVAATNQEKIRPVNPHCLDDSLYPFYPGQRVQVEMSPTSKSARWFCGALEENEDTGIVSSVKADLVYVNWLASVLIGSSLAGPVPPCLQEAENVTLLPCFPHECWQLGDWCICHQPDCEGLDEQFISNRSVFELAKESNSMQRAFERQSSQSNFQEVFVIVKTKTVVDVEWQDGARSSEVDTHSLVPVNVVNSHEFWPGQYVFERGTCDDSNISSNKKWGVVTGADGKERTVKVKWKSASVNHTSDPQDDLKVETVSAYELEEHPDYSYCFGDVVLKNVNKVDVHHPLNEAACMHKKIVLNSKHSESMYSSKAFLSRIGCVTGFEDGFVEVIWASGLKTTVEPEDIFRIDKREGLAASLFQELNSEELYQGMANREHKSSIKENDWSNSDEISKGCKNHQSESSSHFFPQSAVGFFMNIATSLFESFASASSMPSKHASEEGNHIKTPEDNEIAKACDFSTEMQPLVSCEVQRDADIRRNALVGSSSKITDQEQFRHFDIVGDCSDHHFLNSSCKGVELTQVNRAWLKKVKKEWNILEKDLPELIYIRTYEERMDLLRAAIIGAPGTPYHNGLFFFDIYLPPQYPYEPPLVHYNSGGLRVNPNLYESGKALVLNEKPFFNEAGYEMHVGKLEGEKNSVSYNENAFLTTWKSMLYLLRRPPKHFEALVVEHLNRHSQDILSVIMAYMDGTPVTRAFRHGQNKRENGMGSSTGFKLMLAKIFQKLVELLSARGIECSQLTELDT